MNLRELIQTHTLLQEVECGVELPPGWVQIVHDLATRLESIDGVIISQVKSKFGGLRVYTQLGSSDDDAVNRLIAEAEKQAAYTCDVCGCGSGHLVVTNFRRYMVRCHKHEGTNA